MSEQSEVEQGRVLGDAFQARALMLRTEPLCVSALRVSIAIAALSLAACGKPGAGNNTADDAVIAVDNVSLPPQPPPQQRPPEKSIIYWNATPTDGDLGSIYDSETGCFYIAYGTDSSGAAITPRLDGHGRPMCGKAQEKAR